MLQQLCRQSTKVSKFELFPVSSRYSLNSHHVLLPVALPILVKSSLRFGICRHPFLTIYTSLHGWPVFRGEWIPANRLRFQERSIMSVSLGFLQMDVLRTLISPTPGMRVDFPSWKHWMLMLLSISVRRRSMYSENSVPRVDNCLAVSENVGASVKSGPT